MITYMFNPRVHCHVVTLDERTSFKPLFAVSSVSGWTVDDFSFDEKGALSVGRLGCTREQSFAGHVVDLIETVTGCVSFQGLQPSKCAFRGITS